MEKSVQLVHQELNLVVDQLSSVVEPILDHVAARGTMLRAYVCIVGVGLLFWVVEAALMIFVKPLLIKVFRQPANGKVDAKMQLKKANATATQAIARLVGSIHNSIQVPLGLLLLLDSRFRSDRIYASSSLSLAMCYLSAGYFLHDLVMCLLRFALEGPLYTIHALVCHASYTFGVVSGLLHYHGAAFLMWEISTPFVHTRWFMYKAGWANSFLYVANGLLMIAAFFGCRISWGYTSSYFLVKDVVGEQIRVDSLFPMVATVGYCIVAVVMNSLNTYWFVKMLAAAVAVILKGKKAADVGSHKDE